MLLFVSIIAIVIPVYVISAASQRNQEIQMLVSQRGQPDTSLLNSTWTMETSQNANPIATPSNTPIPTATITPSTTLNPIPVSGNSNAYITEVVHIENGSQTMVKILFLEKLEGNFFAKVENLWSELDYSCVIFGVSKQNLFCSGVKLWPATQAAIRVFEEEVGSEDSTLVFLDTFEVPYLILQPTKTKVPSAAPTPTFMPTPINTYTPTQTFTPTPTPTDTLKPTNTPQPTNTPRPTHTPRPTKTPK